MLFICQPAGGMTKRPKCTMLCFACRRFQATNSTCYAEEQTQTGTQLHVIQRVFTYLISVYNLICFTCAERSQTVSWRLISAIISRVEMMKMPQTSESPLLYSIQQMQTQSNVSPGERCFYGSRFNLSFFVRSHYVYGCLDARFYDDEMLTVVLQGSEELNSRRVLAQIPISSILSCEAEFNWEPHLRCVFMQCFDLASFNDYKSLSDS